MKRLFLAIPIEEKYQVRLLSEVSCVKNFHAKKMGDLHITLCFLGSVSPRDEEQLIQDIEFLNWEGFSLTFSSYGFFYHRDKSVIWMGLEEEKRLLTLQKKVQHICQKILHTQRKKFVPHITLGKCHIRSFSVESNLFSPSALQGKEFYVDQIGLYSSQLTPKRSLYRLEETFWE